MRGKPARVLLGRTHRAIPAQAGDHAHAALLIDTRGLCQTDTDLGLVNGVDVGLGDIDKFGGQLAGYLIGQIEGIRNQATLDRKIIKAVGCTAQRPLELVDIGIENLLTVHAFIDRAGRLVGTKGQHPDASARCCTSHTATSEHAAHATPGSTLGTH